MRSVSVLLVCAFLPIVSAQKPEEKAAPTYPDGEKQVARYFRDQVEKIAANCLTDLTTRADWEAKRPERRQQFLDMMGLWPLPEKTPLNAQITGTVEGDGFIVENLVIQSRPGLYVTANLYRPKEQTGPLPGILYVCGHGNVVENNISYGSKVSYQYHPAWFATHGYVCLILDTLQLSEIPATHHGTYRMNLWWWHCRGYTPGGVELWNGIRALDYLQTRKEVDPGRLGLTGRSGGGATSWWVAAADDRVKAVAPIAGIADLQAQLCEGEVPRLKTGVIAGHCDCMFPVNTYRWDFAEIAALIAPRPLLLGNSDVDDIFPVPGYRRIAEKVKKVYALYGEEDKFQLLETEGPHKDTPELRIGINRWMHRWLRNDTESQVADDLPPKLTPQQLKVLADIPTDEKNTVIHESFVPMASAEEFPKSNIEPWWKERREQLIKELRRQVFAGWPSEPESLGAKVVFDQTHDDVRLRAVDFVSQAEVPLRLFVMTAMGAEEPEQIVLSVLDEPGWEKWIRDLGPAFQKGLGVTDVPKRDDAMFAQNRAAMKSRKLAFAAIAPRGIGPTRWAADGTVLDTQIRRRFPLIGQTLDGQRVWDVRRAIEALQTIPEMKAGKLVLHGEGVMAGIALYAAIFEPSVSRLELHQLPARHRQGPILLNVLKVLDLPQALALAAPRTVTLHTTEPDAWTWTKQLQDAVGGRWLTVRPVGD